MKPPNFAAGCRVVGIRVCWQGLGRVARGTWYMSSIGCPSLNAHFWTLVYYKKSGCRSSTPNCVYRHSDHNHWSPVRWLCNRWAASSSTPRVWLLRDGTEVTLDGVSQKTVKLWEIAVWERAMRTWSISDAPVGSGVALSSVPHPLILTWPDPKTCLPDLTMDLSHQHGLAQQLLCCGCPWFPSPELLDCPCSGMVGLCPYQWDCCLPSSPSVLAQGSPSLVV